MTTQERLELESEFNAHYDYLSEAYGSEVRLLEAEAAWERQQEQRWAAEHPEEEAKAKAAHKAWLADYWAKQPTIELTIEDDGNEVYF
jgi:hypothetical protein